MKKSGFKMKNPSIAKMAKEAGSPMKKEYDVKKIVPQPPKKKLSYDDAYLRRDMKLYGGLNKADYIKEAKRQKATKESKVLKKGGTYDVPTKPMETKSKVKKVDSKKPTDAKKITKTVAEPKAKPKRRRKRYNPRLNRFE